MSNGHRTSRRAACTALAAWMLLALLMAVPSHAAFAAAPEQIPVFTADLPAEAVLSAGGGVWLSARAAVQGNENAEIRYQWYKDGIVIQGAEHSGITVTAAGKYHVTAANKSNLDAVAQSKTCTVSAAGAAPGAGSLYVTGYTVLNADGNEVQKVSPGQKCQIIVSVRDSRFDSVPAAADAYGNIVNVKITSTASFASPSFGDIRQTTPAVENGELKFAVIFNDITYLGGDNTLKFDIAYAQMPVAMQSVSCGISQCQTDTQKANSAKPMVMVKSADYGGANISAGQAFTLTLTSYNTSKTAEITDVKTTLTLPASLTLAAGSNTVLREALGAGGSYTTTFELQAQSSAETGVANLTVDYQYYIKGTDQQLSSSQMITVPLVQPERFSFTSMELPQEAYVGEEITLTLNYVNKGKGTLYNLSSEIAASGAKAAASDPYLGNLASGTQGSADFMVTADGPGTVTGTITLVYEDVNGREKKQTKEFTLTVSAAPANGGIPGMGDMPGMGGMDGVPGGAGVPRAGMPLWGWGLIAAAAIAAAVTAIVLLKKKKAKRMAALLAEDDADEEF